MIKLDMKTTTSFYRPKDSSQQDLLEIKVPEDFGNTDNLVKVHHEYCDILFDVFDNYSIEEISQCLLRYETLWASFLHVQPESDKTNSQKNFRKLLNKYLNEYINLIKDKDYAIIKQNLQTYIEKELKEF